MSAAQSRRGVAMLAALWLVVGISVVALEFSLVGRERRSFGIGAVDRAHGSAAALGAFAMTQAKLEAALRVFPSTATGSLARLRASDPWLDVDSLYSGTIVVDRTGVTVEVVDLGTKLNVNTLSETEWKTFFTNLIGDFVKSDALAQAIVDWRDPDDIPRVQGGERDDYIKAGLLRLPSNQLFRDVEELLDVKGMTPEIYALVSPYLTTLGAAQVNLNSAPVPVLRVLTGMTDEILARILSQRSRGARIASVAEIMPPAPQSGLTQQVQTAIAAQNQRAQQQLSARAGVNTTQIQLTMLVRASPASRPTRLRVVLQRSNQNGTPASQVLGEEWR